MGNNKFRKYIKSIIRTTLICILVFSNIFDHQIISFAGKENPIPVVICCDDNYTYPAIICVTSLLDSAEDTTFYRIFVLVPECFSEQNKSKFYTVQSIYPDICQIEFINMKDQFKGWVCCNGLTEPAYYRLKIPSVLPQELQKCIYLDVDTVILGDLTELFHQDLAGNLIAGVADERRGFQGVHNDPYSTGLTSHDQYINTGVLLWNLTECRRCKIEQQFMSFLEVNGLEVCDQCVINVTCYDRIFTLPFKFNVQAYFELEKSYEEATNVSRCLTEREWNDALKKQVIVHYAGAKPWVEAGILFANYWWRFAGKSPFKIEILKKYFIGFPDYYKSAVRTYLSPDRAFPPSPQHITLYQPKVSQIPDVSIIIPVYNVEKYLERCLKSVVSQTLPNLEIICVDDGSSDSSPQILDHFASIFPKLKVIHKANGGVSSARNLGLKNARGKYIGFVDSDDYIDERTYEVAYNSALEQDADVVVWGAWVVTLEDPDGRYDGPKKSELRSRELEPKGSLGRSFLMGQFGGFALWNKIYRHKMLIEHDMQFNERMRNKEDSLFNAEIFISIVNKILTIKRPMYHYTQFPTGLVRTLPRDVNIKTEKILQERIDQLMSQYV